MRLLFILDLCLTSVLKQNANNQHIDILKKVMSSNKCLESNKKLRNHILMQIKVISLRNVHIALSWLKKKILDGHQGL